MDQGGEWLVGIDSTVVRAHQHAAGARHEPPTDIPAERWVPWLPEVVEPPVVVDQVVEGRSFRALRTTQGARSNDKSSASELPVEPVEPPVEPVEPAVRAAREGRGRSRGGLSTKVHLLAEVMGRSLARGITAGQRHDAVVFEPLMGRLRIRRSSRGRPRTRRDRLVADQA